MNAFHIVTLETLTGVRGDVSQAEIIPFSVETRCYRKQLRPHCRYRRKSRHIRSKLWRKDNYFEGLAPEKNDKMNNQLEKASQLLIEARHTKSIQPTDSFVICDTITQFKLKTKSILTPGTRLASSPPQNFVLLFTSEG